MSPNWIVDQDGLAQAVSFLGLEYPVLILPTAEGHVGKYHGIGRYGLVAMGKPLEVPTHQVTITASLNPDSGNGIAWHELTHAAQAESFMPEVPEGEEYDPSEYGGLERHEVGIRGFTIAYAAEARGRGSFSNGSHGMSGSYTGISFERQASDAMKFGDDVEILKPAPGVTFSSSRRNRYRVDITPWDMNKYPCTTQYVLAYTAESARKFVIDEYEKERMPGQRRLDAHDVRTYICPSEPGDE